MAIYEGAVRLLKPGNMQAGCDCNEFIEIKVETTPVITVNLSTLPGSVVKHGSAAHLHVDFCNL